MPLDAFPPVSPDHLPTINYEEPVNLFSNPQQDLVLLQRFEAHAVNYLVHLFRSKALEHKQLGTGKQRLTFTILRLRSSL